MESPPPFDKIDRLNITVKGFELTSVFKPDGWRKYLLIGALLSGVFWIILGYESCFDQVEHGLQYFIGYLLGTKTWNQVLEMTQYRYGVATHFSAMVIYGVMFYAISKYYEKINIMGSLNLFMSFALTTLSIAVFEYSWMASYYFAQQQWWVLTPLTTQASILYQNLLFAVAGIFLILFVWACPYLRFRRNKKFYFLVLLSVGFWFLWYFYPFQITKIQVPVETAPGVMEIWEPRSNFPQTLYTIDRVPYDDDAVGEPFFVEDNLLHSVNLFMKIVWTYTFFYVGKVVLRKENIS